VLQRCGRGVSARNRGSAQELRIREHGRVEDEDFEDALARALHGEVMTDLRPPPELLAALVVVAAARTAAERRTAVRAARALHERSVLDDVEDADVDEREDLFDDDGFRIE